MIKITHQELSRINKDYTDKILEQFEEKKTNIFKIISLMQSKDPVTAVDVKGNVKALLKALKVVLNSKELKTPTLQTKETDFLVHHINENRIFDAETIKTKTTRLLDVSNQVNAIFNSGYLRPLISKAAVGLKDLNQYFTKYCVLDTLIYLYFFDYEDYYGILNSHIANKLGIKCCPYCNRNYITSVQNIKGKRIIGPTYDHYFHKKIYKFLTLSFYNLIPSCYICNSNLKGQIDFGLDTHLHPYYDEFGADATFDFNLDLVNSGNTPEKIFEPKIKINTTSPAIILKLKGLDKDAKNKKTGSLKVFQLEEIYKSHFDTVEEIHTKFDRNSPYYINSIKDNLDALGVPEGEFYRFHFHNYYNIEDFHKKPLSKLMRDIYDKMKQLQSK
ncbi:hypothetical protein [Flavobacterium suzhouense]|uniref:HNH endonuclease n=1 Tax=Flavobacterium suzhouense TaxID=1529638 RepID=A0ABW5NVB1_9FLAO